ncbi:MAG: response regulator [Candidatus Scalindua sp.]
MNKGKILVIDDEIELCVILDRFFSKRGYDVMSAYSGTEAIALLKNEEFDLVLCDYVMPDVSGYDVAMFLNTLEKRPKIGIITGWGELINTNEREEMKVNFVITKPFDFSELMKQVDDTLGANGR